MPRQRSSLPSELPDSFSVLLARAHGVTPRRLRGEDLRRQFHGARVQHSDSIREADDPDEPWWMTRAREFDRLIESYLPVMPPDAFFCGPTAAHLWSIPLPGYVEPDLYVGVFRPRTAPVRPHVRGRQFTLGFVQVTRLDGIDLTDAASTWATLGSDLSEDDLVAAADRLLHIPHHPGGFRPVTEVPLSAREELEEIASRKGRPGAPALRRALALARTGSASPPETRVRLLIRDAGLPEPDLDVDIYDEYGRFLGCSELAYPELKVAIEYESDGHLTRAQLQRDIDKYQLYAEAGWSVVRLTSSHIFTAPSEAVRRIRRARAAASAP